ncbi:DEKNAAC103076 [Brettanomyces naardenensis]|uniref:Actin cytoskeleton-regulatory complex protein END3 n=1 Tax=Brettanomyces naardenensis TaxID=13370 RepID=A0A448YMD3_BRENA|nr:DEKNAAC103076 [Brettanomyces naardenensis]
MPKLEQWEIKKYWQIFCGLKPDDNKLSKEKLDPVFRNSHLSDELLSQIWLLADIDEDGQLDFEEFCIAMRLIFDLVNGSIDEVPDSLPGWLIPGSKRQLVDSKASSSSQGGTGDGSSSDDDEYSLSDDFDWYISPTDKSTYQTVYDSSCDRFGRISFNSLQDLYGTLQKVPQTDISSAWNLVNPKQSETIDRDQCMVFLHILNQRSNGRRVPRSVPASLRATFSKELPEYDVNSHQGDVHIREEENTGFASGFLRKKGISNGSGGDDLNETSDKNWEEVKLRRELKDLEDKLERAEREKNNRGKDDDKSMSKYEYEQLLKYKESELSEVGKTNWRGLSENIGSVDSQVVQLREFLENQNKELEGLRSEVSKLRT